MTTDIAICHTSNTNLSHTRHIRFIDISNYLRFFFRSGRSVSAVLRNATKCITRVIWKIIQLIRIKQCGIDCSECYSSFGFTSSQPIVIVVPPQNQNTETREQMVRDILVLFSSVFVSCGRTNNTFSISKYLFTTVHRAHTHTHIYHTII